MKDCPPDAIHRAPNGEVFIDDKCIGCGNCERNCPYGVIQMAAVPAEKPGLLSWLLFGAGNGPGEDKSPEGMAQAHRQQARGQVRHVQGHRRAGRPASGPAPPARRSASIPSSSSAVDRAESAVMRAHTARLAARTPARAGARRRIGTRSFLMYRRFLYLKIAGGGGARRRSLLYLGRRAATVSAMAAPGSATRSARPARS